MGYFIDRRKREKEGHAEVAKCARANKDEEERGLDERPGGRA